MNIVFRCEVTLTAILQSKKVVRQSEALIGVKKESDISLELLNAPEVLHAAIPRFISGKLRDQYKITAFKVVGKVGI